MPLTRSPAHCKICTYDVFAQVRLAMMDGPSNRAWVDAHSSVVKGYPSLLVYRNGVYVTSYKGHYSFRYNPKYGTTILNTALHVHEV
jgi:hypothetical protein